MLPTDVQSMLYLECRRLLDRSIRWLVQQPPREHRRRARGRALPAGVRRAGRRCVPYLLVGAEQERLRIAGRRVRRPRGPARPRAAVRPGCSTRSRCSTSSRSPNAEKLPADEVAGVYFAISERIEVDQMLTRITGLPRDDRWSALARSALRYDLYAAMAGLTQNVLTSTSSGDEPGRADHGLGAAERRGRGARRGDARPRSSASTATTSRRCPSPCARSAPCSAADCRVSQKRSGCGGGQVRTFSTAGSPHLSPGAVDLTLAEARPDAAGTARGRGRSRQAGAVAPSGRGPCGSRRRRGRRRRR